MLELGYFPGCSLHKSSRNYGESVEKLFRLLDIGLTEVEDWNCCGATSAHFLDHELALSLSARNLALAEGQRQHTILAPCAACYQRLLAANRLLVEDLPGSAEIRKALDPLTYGGSVSVRNLLDVLTNEVGTLKLSALVRKPLRSLKAAPYYGCLLVRTPGSDCFEDREDPTSMDRMLEAVGAEVVSWPSKTDCCGASLAISEEESANKRIDRILAMAEKCGANCVVTACPLCQTNLDMFQYKRAKTADRSGLSVPVFFLSELLGLALGAKIGRREWRKHFVRPEALLKGVAGFTPGP